MTAALATLPFLATLWLLVVLGAAVLEESGAKIAAALKGELGHPRSTGSAPARLRTRVRTQNARCANAAWRAAA
jgi:hypothetical protein